MPRRGPQATCLGVAESEAGSRASTAHAIYGDHRMATFHYVYILKSEVDPNSHYTGRTNDLTQ